MQLMKPALSEEIQKLAECQARLSKVFSNPQRVLILWLLADREKTVSEIAEAIGATLPRTSQHLHLMKLSNILESRRDRKNMYYRIADNELLQNCLVLANRPRDQLIEIAYKFCKLYDYTRFGNDCSHQSVADTRAGQKNNSDCVYPWACSFYSIRA